MIKVVMTIEDWLENENKHKMALISVHDELRSVRVQADSADGTIARLSIEIEGYKKHIKMQEKTIGELRQQEDKYIRELRASEIVITGHVETIRDLNSKLRPKGIMDLVPVVLGDYHRRIIEKQGENVVIYGVQPEDKNLATKELRIRFAMYDDDVMGICVPEWTEVRATILDGGVIQDKAIDIFRKTINDWFVNRRDTF